MAIDEKNIKTTVNFLESPLPWAGFTRAIQDGLLEPFPLDEIEFLPKTLTKDGTKALALPYIDARAVMNRLDAVVGTGGWSFDWEPVCNDSSKVKGKLTVLGITKCDVGEAKQEEEKVKAAVSDALKRCAVHFGVGRFLYYLPPIWAPIDQYKKWVGTPDVKMKDIENACRIIGFTGDISLKPRQVRRDADESNDLSPGVHVIPLTEEQSESLTIKSDATIPSAESIRASIATLVNVCEVCKTPIAASQAAISRRKFTGRTLCPVHQHSI